jgi:hypothetical protein
MWPDLVHFCLQDKPHTALLGTFSIPDQLQLFIPKFMQKMLYFAFWFWFKDIYVRKVLKRAHYRRYNTTVLDYLISYVVQLGIFIIAPVFLSLFHNFSNFDLLIVLIMYAASLPFQIWIKLSPFSEVGRLPFYYICGLSFKMLWIPLLALIAAQTSFFNKCSCNITLLWKLSNVVI